LAKAAADAVRRHGGIVRLLGASIRILLSQGAGGLRARAAFHSKRLQGDEGVSSEPAELPAGAQAPVSAPSEAHRFARTDPDLGGRPPGVHLIGHPYGVLGRAEDIRTAAWACDRAAIPFDLSNMLGDYGKDDAIRHREFPFFDRVGKARGRRANLFFLNADEMDVAYRYQGDGVFRGPYNIACFAWELSRYPDPWLPALDYLHEVWAPSRFVQQAIAEKTRLPVVWMPLAVEPGEAPALPRSRFGLPPDAFLFLFFFDFRSFVQRKNPWAVLQAFTRAFAASSSKPVGLVVKVNGVQHDPEAYRTFLESFPLQDPRVRIINEVLDDREIKGLVSLCDCFVSLHRSEGFGRGLAEAMYFGKPVIGTAYSGNLDFMCPDTSCLVDSILVPVGEGDYPHGEGQVWADADVEQAAWYMRRMTDDPTAASERGRRAARAIRETNSFRAVGERYRRRLRTLGVVDA
jgi:glycosyltransferase involved in cell wall biosynthesis